MSHKSIDNLVINLYGCKALTGEEKVIFEERSIKYADD